MSVLEPGGDDAADHEHAPLPSEHEIARMNARNARAAMMILGAIALIIVAGGIALAWTSRTIPDALIAIGGGAVGAIAGILVPSRD